MLMPSSPISGDIWRMQGRVPLRDRLSGCRQGLRRIAIDLADAAAALPHRRTRQARVKQDLRRRQGIAVGNKGGKAACGIFAIGSVESDFVALHINPDQRPPIVGPPRGCRIVLC